METTAEVKNNIDQSDLIDIAMSDNPIFMNIDTRLYCPSVIQGKLEYSYIFKISQNDTPIGYIVITSQNYAQNTYSFDFYFKSDIVETLRKEIIVKYLRVFSLERPTMQFQCNLAACRAEDLFTLSEISGFKNTGEIKNRYLLFGEFCDEVQFLCEDLNEL